MSEKIFDVVIIGSGPAGYTAAIYASRAGLATALVSGEVSGGQLMLTSEVENFPGFTDGILGPDLIANMESQAKRFGTEFITDHVMNVECDASPVKLSLESKKTLLAKSVIIATGSSAKWLGLASEQEFMGRGVTACATCDGFFFTGKKVVVVGGGDSAMEEALTLTKYATEVTIIHRRDSFRASKIMQDRVLQHPKINVIWDSEIVEVQGSQTVNAVKIRNIKTKATTTLPTDGVFVAIGHNPATGFLNGQLPLDEKGYIKPTDGVKTKYPAVFVAGDVADSRYRQAITAAGDGCRAALEAEHYLATL